MAKSIRLDTMRTRTRELANHEVAASSSFIPDAEANRRINRAIEELYNMLIEARGADYYASSATPVSTVAGTATYNLESDFMQLLQMTADDGSVYVQLQPWMHQEYAHLLQLESNNTDGLAYMKYRLTPTQFELRPTPQAVYTINYRYIPTFTDLATDASTFDGINGFEEWACLTAAIGMLAKEESDPSVLMAERARIERRIQALAGARDAGQPEVWQDVARDWEDSYYSGLADWIS